MVEQLLIKFTGTYHPDPIEIQIEQNQQHAQLREIFLQSSDEIDSSAEYEFFIFNTLFPRDISIQEFIQLYPSIQEKINSGELNLEITYQNSIKFSKGNENESPNVTSSVSKIFSDDINKLFFTIDIKNNLSVYQIIDNIMNLEESVNVDIGRISSQNTMDTNAYDNNVYICLGGSRGIVVMQRYDMKAKSFNFQYRVMFETPIHSIKFTESFENVFISTSNQIQMLNLFDKLETHKLINQNKKLKFDLNKEVNITDKVYSDKKIFEEKVSQLDHQVNNLICCSYDGRIVIVDTDDSKIIANRFEDHQSIYCGDLNPQQGVSAQQLLFSTESKLCIVDWQRNIDHVVWKWKKNAAQLSAQGTLWTGEYNMLASMQDGLYLFDLRSEKAYVDQQDVKNSIHANRCVDDAKLQNQSQGFEKNQVGYININ